MDKKKKIDFIFRQTLEFCEILGFKRISAKRIRFSDYIFKMYGI